MISSCLKKGDNNFIGKNVIIHDNVIIGNNNKIYDGTVIYPNTIIGNNNIILDNNTLGEYGVEAKYDFEEKKFKGLEIGDNNYFHVNNLIFGGFYKKTLIGNHNKFLSQVTIHHDNIIHNNVVFYPRAITAGLCTLMDYSTMGMNSSLQQRSVVGSYSMIGMGSVASHNIFPFYIYFNGKYQRFNKVKVPDELNIYQYEDELLSLIKNLKNNKFDLKNIENCKLSENVKAIVIRFLNEITIKKI